MRLKWAQLASVIAGFSLLLAACGTSVSPTPTPSAPAPADQPKASEPIKVGVVTSLTGPNAATGKQVAVGVQQAAKEWNENGGVLGRQIVVEVEDDAGNPTGVVNAYNKLISGKPAAMWLPTFTPLVMAAETGVVAAKVPTFTSATGTVITKSGDGWFFRLRTNDQKQGVLAGTFATEELKAKKPALIYPSNDYGKGGAAAVKEALEKAGIALAAEETYNQGDKDISTQLRKIKTSGADLLISWTIPTDSGMVAVQAQQVDVGMPILGGPGFGTPEYLSLAQDATNGIYVIVDAAVGFGDVGKDFVTKVQSNFKDTPVSFVVSANYDGAMMLFAAMKQAGTTDGAKVREALLATKDHKGVTGPYSFDSEGNGLHQGVLAKWENMKLNPIRTTQLP